MGRRVIDTCTTVVDRHKQAEGEPLRHPIPQRTPGPEHKDTTRTIKKHRYDLEDERDDVQRVTTSVGEP